MPNDRFLSRFWPFSRIEARRNSGQYLWGLRKVSLPVFQHDILYRELFTNRQRSVKGVSLSLSLSLSLSPETPRSVSLTTQSPVHLPKSPQTTMTKKPHDIIRSLIPKIADARMRRRDRGRVLRAGLFGDTRGGWRRAWSAPPVGVLGSDS